MDGETIYKDPRSGTQLRRMKECFGQFIMAPQRLHQELRVQASKQSGGYLDTNNELSGIPDSFVIYT